MDFYILGIAVGLIFGVCLFFFIYAKRKKAGNYEYDERQMAGRGKAFQYGFYTVLVAGCVYACADFADMLPGKGLPWLVGALLLGVAVFALAAIHFDAYYGFRARAGSYYIMGVCFMLAMVFTGISNVSSGDPDKAAFGIVNFEVAALWLVIVVALLLHQRGSKEEG